METGLTPTPEEVAQYIEKCMSGAADFQPQDMSGSISYSLEPRFTSIEEWRAHEPQPNIPAKRSTRTESLRQEFSGSPLSDTRLSEVVKAADRLAAGCNLAIIKDGPHLTYNRHDDCIELYIDIVRPETHAEFAYRQQRRRAIYRAAYLRWASREGEWDEPKPWIRYVEEPEAVGA